MKNLLVVLVLLLVAILALGYYRGWFSVTQEDGNVQVQTDSAKFKRDKALFTRLINQRAQDLKDTIAGLRQKSEGLTGDAKTQAEEEVADLEKKRERLEKQLQELESAGADKFETIKEDLGKSLQEVEMKIDRLTRKLDREKAKEKDKAK
jgi:hypothetical protein